MALTRWKFVQFLMIIFSDFPKTQRNYFIQGIFSPVKVISRPQQDKEIYVTNLLNSRILNNKNRSLDFLVWLSFFEKYLGKKRL